MLKTICLCAIFSIFPVLAELPDAYEITSLDIASLRLSAVNLDRFDLESTHMFNPFLVQSINSILRQQKIDTLKSYKEGGVKDTTASYYLIKLRERGCDIYIAEKPQTRALQILVANDIPVLLLGKLHDPTKKMLRIHADIINSYRLPDFAQSKNKLPGEFKYVLGTARKYDLVGKEQFEPLKTDDDSRGPFARFTYFCVITTPKLSIKKIQAVIDKGLSDTNSSIEYKVPEFSRIKNENVSDFQVK